jgi:hypothetical protein
LVNAYNSTFVPQTATANITKSILTWKVGFLKPFTMEFKKKKRKKKKEKEKM